MVRYFARNPEKTMRREELFGRTSEVGETSRDRRTEDGLERIDQPHLREICGKKYRLGEEGMNDDGTSVGDPAIYR